MLVKSCLFLSKLSINRHVGHGILSLHYGNGKIMFVYVWSPGFASSENWSCEGGLLVF